MASEAPPSLPAQSLVEFINQCPFGLIQTNASGEISLVNAYATQLLFPVAISYGQPLDNCWQLLAKIAPHIRQTITEYEVNYGSVCENERVEIVLPPPTPSLHLSFSITRLGEDSYQVAFKEVNNVVEAEETARLATMEAATQAGKAEIASGILHDIGNAVTAFGSHTAKLNALGNWEETQHIHRLRGLFAAKSDGLDDVLGAGKGDALLHFMTAVEEGLQKRQQTVQEIGQQLLEVTSHIQEVLNIQRHYTRGMEKGQRALIRPHDLIEDSLVMVGRMFEKRGIQIEKDVPYHLPSFSGDQTKMIQVCVNLLKNAAEAYDDLEDDRERCLHLQGKADDTAQEVELSIRDNAAGIAPEQLARIFERGKTSKSQGSGLGLHNCQQIVETHMGRIWAESPGPGKGTTFFIRIPFET
ncbi:MAG: HAMP domain-containing sensor histidine kinase [Bacteroidota bacterium]